LNKLTDSMADSLNDFPPGEPCEWPIESFDDEEEADELNADGDVECADDGEIAADDDDLLGEPPAGDAAVEIVAIAEGEAAGAAACGEEGVVGLREIDAAELLAIEDDAPANVLAEAKKSARKGLGDLKAKAARSRWNAEIYRA
jgi:hypothetical protein